jgi:hypothetical protein
VDEDEVACELAMPFVVCRSQNGPYDDEAFVAGWALACIDVRLTQCAVDRLPLNVPVRTPSLPQAELIAMSHGYLTAVELYEDAPEEWSMVTFIVPAREP